MYRVTGSPTVVSVVAPPAVVSVEAGAVVVVASPPQPEATTTKASASISRITHRVVTLRIFRSPFRLRSARLSDRFSLPKSVPPWEDSLPDHTSPSEWPSLIVASEAPPNMFEAARSEDQEEYDRQTWEDQAQTDGGLGVHHLGQRRSDLGCKELKQLYRHHPVYDA